MDNRYSWLYAHPGRFLGGVVLSIGRLGGDESFSILVQLWDLWANYNRLGRLATHTENSMNPQLQYQRSGQCQ